MEPYLFGKRNGIHVIDLDRTLEKLNQALDYVRDTASRGGVILFLGTKRQAKGIVQKYAEECGMPHVTGRWLGGTLTNYGEVSLLVKRYNELLDKQKSGGLDKYTKKERVRISKEIKELEHKVGGMKDMVRPPDAMFIIDIKKEKTALSEANVKNITVVALTDSNVNPEKVAYPIPSNDDAVKAIEIMTKLISGAANEGRDLRQKHQQETAEAKAAGPSVKAKPKRFVAKDNEATKEQAK